MKLTVHIIVFNKGSLADRQNIFVEITGVSCIKRFCSILSNQTNEKAMMFALSNGRIIDQSQISSGRKAKPSNGAGGSTHVILTKNGIYWDLM